MQYFDTRKVVLYFLAIALLLICEVEISIGGRSGGSRGGSSSRSSSRSSSSTRWGSSSSSSSTRYGSSSGSSYSSYSRSTTRNRVRVSVNVGHRSYRYYSRPWGTGYGYTYVSWYSYGSSGHLYGYNHYTRTRRYYDNPNKEPQICYNSHDFDDDNGTALEYFICPEENQPDDYEYCCGDDDRQECCGFWDSGSRVGGFVAGLIVFVILVGLTVYCCCCRRTAQRPQPFFQSRILTVRQPTPSVTVQYTVANTTDMNPPVHGLKPDQPMPMYPVSPHAPSPEGAGIGYQPPPVASNGLAPGMDQPPLPPVSPPPPYGATTLYPTVPGDPGLPYPAGPAATAAYPGGSSYPLPPEAWGAASQYPGTGPEMPMYPVSQVPGVPAYPESNPYPVASGQIQAPYPMGAPYGVPPASGPSYPVSPVPPYSQ